MFNLRNRRKRHGRKYEPRHTSTSTSHGLRCAQPREHASQTHDVPSRKRIAPVAPVLPRLPSAHSLLIARNKSLIEWEYPEDPGEDFRPISGASIELPPLRRVPAFRAHARLVEAAPAMRRGISHRAEILEPEECKTGGEEAARIPLVDLSPAFALELNDVPSFQLDPAENVPKCPTGTLVRRPATRRHSRSRSSMGAIMTGMSVTSPKSSWSEDSAQMTTKAANGFLQVQW